MKQNILSAMEHSKSLAVEAVSVTLITGR